MKRHYIIIFLLLAFVLSPAVSAASLSHNSGGFKMESVKDFKANGPVLDLSNEFSDPWGLRRLSPIYQYDTLGLSRGQKLTLTISYSEVGLPGVNEVKDIYFYDKKNSVWRLLGGVDYPEKKEMRIETSMPFAPLAVFSYPSSRSIGQATWYAYKGGNYAASPDYPKGTKLKVTNTDNNKSVVVTVNDYGPDRRLYPQRAIDLDKVAFAKIASLSAGVINVKVEPVFVADKKTAVGLSFKPYSKAVALYDTKNKEFLYEYNGDTLMPLASLTKVVAVKTFLDIPGNRNRLEEVVDYQYADEAHNYLYCNVWESARLRVKTGDTLTVKDLIYSSLVGSANNTVETLVRHSGLSRETFITQMNSWAKEQGATKTRFYEPTGLDPENVTTAKEYALLATAALSDPMVSIPAATWKYSFNNVNNDEPHNLKNTNYLLGSFKYSFFASKTGYLNEAAHCLMMATHSTDTDIIVVSLGAATKASSVSDVEALIKYGLMVSN